MRIESQSYLSFMVTILLSTFMLTACDEGPSKHPSTSIDTTQVAMRTGQSVGQGSSIRYTLDNLDGQPLLISTIGISGDVDISVFSDVQSQQPVLCTLSHNGTGTLADDCVVGPGTESILYVVINGVLPSTYTLFVIPDFLDTPQQSNTVNALVFGPAPGGALIDGIAASATRYYATSNSGNTSAVALSQGTHILGLSGLQSGVNPQLLIYSDSSFQHPISCVSGNNVETGGQPEDCIFSLGSAQVVYIKVDQSSGNDTGFALELSN